MACRHCAMRCLTAAALRASLPAAAAPSPLPPWRWLDLRHLSCGNDLQRRSAALQGVGVLAARPLPAPMPHLSQPVSARRRLSFTAGARDKRRQQVVLEADEPAPDDQEGLGEAEEDLELGDPDLLEGEEDEAPAGSLDTGTADWGAKALEAARSLLAQPEWAALELYSFRAAPRGIRRVDVRLEKPGDRWGSPALEEVEGWARAFNDALAESLGEELADSVTVEVSSPGAERALRVPADLLRFAELPMRVEYDLDAAESSARPAAPAAAGDAAAASTSAAVGSGAQAAPASGGQGKAGGGGDGARMVSRVLEVVGVEEATGSSTWRLANVRANRQGGKGNRLTKKQQEERFHIPLAAIRRANLYIDI